MVEEGRDSLFNRFPNRFIDTVTDGFSCDGALEYSYFFQLDQVLRDGGLRQSQFIHEVRTDTGFLFDEVLDDGNAGRMAKDFEGCCELILLVGKDFGFCGSHVSCVMIAILRY